MAVLRTVTLNTGYDDYFTVSGLAWGGVGAMHDFRSVCSGKGISCARTAVALGLDTVAYALIGADDQPDYSARLTAEGIAHTLVAVPGVLAFKPNDDEILALPAVAAADPADRVRVALDAFAAAGARLPLVSLGAHGVAFLDGARLVRAACHVERPVQSVMAGDALVAGLAWGVLGGDEPTGWVRQGLAAAAAHVAGHRGPDFGEAARANLPRVELAGTQARESTTARPAARNDSPRPLRSTISAMNVAPTSTDAAS